MAVTLPYNKEKKNGSIFLLNLASRFQNGSMFTSLSKPALAERYKYRPEPRLVSQLLGILIEYRQNNFLFLSHCLFLSRTPVK